MAIINLELDADVEAVVKRYADGIGVPLETVLERAVVYALRSRYPDNSLPGRDRPVDPGYGVDEGDGKPPSAPVRPGQPLPGDQPEVDNSLPRPPFDGTVDNELPDVDYDINLDPDLNPDWDAGHPDQGQPDPEPKD